MRDELFELYRFGAIEMPKSMGKMLAGFEKLKTREEKKAFVASKIKMFKVIKDNVMKAPAMKAAAKMIQKRVRLNKDKKLELEFIDKRRALTDNVIDVEMKVKFIGPKFSGGPEGLVKEAYNKARGEVPEAWMNYRMIITCSFVATNEDGIEKTKGFTTEIFNKDQHDALVENFVMKASVFYVFKLDTRTHITVKFMSLPLAPET